MPPADPPWDPDIIGPVLVLLSGRWVVLVLGALAGGPLRRTILRERLAGVSDKILTDTLRRMERNRLVVRSTVLSVPIEVDYHLTAHAYSLWPVLSSLQEWAASSPGARTL